jgi:hypothetical protein
MIGAFKILLGSGGTDVAELPFFIASTYTGGYAPYNIRKVATGKYAYCTEFDQISANTDYERLTTLFWSPDGVIPVQSAFFEYPTGDSIHMCRKQGGYTYSYLQKGYGQGQPEKPRDRTSGSGWAAADEMGTSGRSTDAFAAWNVASSNEGAGGVVSPRGSSGWRVNNMYIYDTDMLDTARFGYDYTSASYRILQMYNNNSGAVPIYIAKDNSSGTQQWAYEFYPNISSVSGSKVNQIIPLSNGKTILVVGDSEYFIMLNSNGTVQYEVKSDFSLARSEEIAIDSSQTYAYSSNGQYLYRMTLSNGSVHRLSIQSASSVPLENANSNSYQMLAGFDSDGYLWWGSRQYGVNRTNVSGGTPQIVGTYKIDGSGQYSYCTPHTCTVDGDRILIFTTGYANSSNTAYGGFFCCLKTDFSTTTIESYDATQYNNRYGIDQEQGYTQGGSGNVVAYTSAASGSWTSQSTTTTSAFFTVDRSSYDWSTNYSNYTALGTRYTTTNYPQMTPVT